MSYTIENRVRGGIGFVGNRPYTQIHAHSTGNPNSTAQNEADYMNSKPSLAEGYYTHVVGNGRVIQVAPTNQGAWDVGGNWNYETYAAVELIESHRTQAAFEADYRLYCELLHNLANEAGVPATVDNGGGAGIKSHNYCTYNQPGNNSDHVDPYPYLAKWGISRAQFANDVASAGASAAPANGWRNDNGQWQWYENGNKVKDAWRQIDGKWYFFNGVGDMRTGWYSYQDHWYYSDNSGKMLTGWQLIDERWFKLNDGGDMAQGWLNQNGAWYYLKDNGEMAQGWLKDPKAEEESWYFLASPDGHMVTGKQSIDGQEYNFDGSGKWVK